MKFSPLFKFLMLTMGALLAASAYAASASHKGNLHVSDPVQVNGKQLTPGDYTVAWDGDGPDVTVHITREHKEIAAATAKVVGLNEKSSDDAALVTNSPSGKRDLTGVRFAGKAYELDLTSAAQASGGSVK
jgi:hypothetical protein